MKPKFTADFPDAMVKEGIDELTLGKEEEGMLRSFVDTTAVRDRWGPHLVDEDWHAICQAIFKGVEGAEWEDHVRRPTSISQRRTKTDR